MPTTRKPLGRRPPTDWRHVERFPLTAEHMPADPSPVVLGINWYDQFFEPVQIGTRYWIGRGDNWGPIAGGHAICVRPVNLTDSYSWWQFYDQGSEGACVGFSCSRMMTLMNRVRYDARWLYREAQEIDEWPGEDYEGTSVRAGGEILRVRGHCVMRGGVTGPEIVESGISAYRWATNLDDIVIALADYGERGIYDTIEAIPLLNSWGKAYPHVVWLPYKALERLLSEDGEAMLVTDR